MSAFPDLTHFGPLWLLHPWTWPDRRNANGCPPEFIAGRPGCRPLESLTQKKEPLCCTFPAAWTLATICHCFITVLFLFFLRLSSTVLFSYAILKSFSIVAEKRNSFRPFRTSNNGNSLAGFVSFSFVRNKFDLCDVYCLFLYLRSVGCAWLGYRKLRNEDVSQCYSFALFLLGWVPKIYFFFCFTLLWSIQLDADGDMEKGEDSVLEKANDRYASSLFQSLDTR